MSPARRHRDRMASRLVVTAAASASAAALAAATLTRALTPASPGRPSLAARKQARDTAAASINQGAGSVAAAAFDDGTSEAANDNTPAERQPTPESLERLRMAEAKRQLKALQSTEARVELKRQLLPQFDPWVAGLMDAADQAQRLDPGFRVPADDVAVNVLIWRIDVGDLAGAAPLFELALRQDWALPPNFQRNLVVFVVEEAADVSLRDIEGGRPVDLISLMTIQALTGDRDMPDEVRAKMLKAVGRELARRADAPPVDDQAVPAGQRRARLEEAVASLARALELDPQCGVKGELARLRKTLVKEDEPPPPPPPSPKADATKPPEPATPAKATDAPRPVKSPKAADAPPPVKSKPQKAPPSAGGREGRQAEHPEKHP
ncbi:MAG: phage terminase small subunit [Phenylobacterium sp.]|nr:phage terminase small subunit [Phenylobacterium sp.]